MARTANPFGSRNSPFRRLRGGLTIRIVALVDALGNLICCLLPQDLAHDRRMT